jgi:hypothetical protein
MASHWKEVPSLNTTLSALLGNLNSKFKIYYFENGYSNELPVHATMASHWKEVPSLNTTLSSVRWNESRCSSAPRSTTASTKPAFLHPNLL